MEPVYSGVRCKTEDCQGVILLKPLGLYDPERITIPECEEDNFSRRCDACHRDHLYKMEDARLFFVRPVSGD
jgi:hypothetical protein